MWFKNTPGNIRKEETILMLPNVLPRKKLVNHHRVHTVGVGGMAWFLGWVFEFSSGVSFSIAINVKNMKITYFLDLMQFPRLAPPKTGQNWQKWENSNCLYIFGDFFALFLPDFQNVGTKIFQKASSFQKKNSKIFWEYVKITQNDQKFKFLIFLHQKV